MNEEDYLELQNLLTKYRIHCLKKIGNVETESDKRSDYYLQVRYIDKFRNKIDLILEEEK